MTGDELKYLADMELRLVREIQGVREDIPSEAQVRGWARDEMGINTRQAWGIRSALIAGVMFFVSVSTFVVTMIRDTSPPG